MNERLSELYHGVAVHATADLEHMAALELLTLVMLADHHVDPAEMETIRELSEEWRGGAFSFDQYVGQAVAKVRHAIQADEIDALIAEVDDRISSRVLRRALFSAARDVAGVDDSVSPEEGSVLAEIAVRFG